MMHNEPAPDFTKDFFKKPVFLTVSGQLNAEIFASSMSNVYTFGPTFRAENSQTSRHLAEFWMIEPEVAFADLEEITNLAEDYVKFTIGTALAKCDDDMDFFEKIEKIFSKSEKKTLNTKWWSTPLRERLIKITDQSKFGRLSYDEAIKILEKSQKKFAEKPVWGCDLTSEHETYLTEALSDKPVIVYNYPTTIKPFYMRKNDDNKTVAAFDLLVPGIGELIGGGQREERLSFLEARIKEMHLNPETYDWYIDLRRYGTVPHSGFGLGFERLVLITTGLENIRDAIPFPRYEGHVNF